MINVNLVCVGSLKEKFFKEAVEEYKKRLTKFCKLNIVEIAEYKVNNKINNSLIEITQKKESEQILKMMSGYVVLLDVQGQALSSDEFAGKINNISLQCSEITFIIGGSYGVSNELKQKVDFTFSFSKLTFPHQLMRVIFLEQLYRAFTINNNITYHK